VSGRNHLPGSPSTPGAAAFRVGGFKSEWWAQSIRYGERHQIATPVRHHRNLQTAPVENHDNARFISASQDRNFDCSGACRCELRSLNLDGRGRGQLRSGGPCGTVPLRSSQYVVAEVGAWVILHFARLAGALAAGRGLTAAYASRRPDRRQAWPAPRRRGNGKAFQLKQLKLKFTTDRTVPWIPKSFPVPPVMVRIMCQ
jgi:hypothetical protein